VPGFPSGGGAVRHRLDQQGRVDGGEEAEEEARDGGARPRFVTNPRRCDVDRVPLLVVQQAKVDGDGLAHPNTIPVPSRSIMAGEGSFRNGSMWGTG